MIAYLKGVKTVWITDPSIAQKVLQASNSKGVFIEQMFAMSAWDPILSLESVDGEQWARMKTSLMELIKLLPPTSLLTEITTEIVQSRVNKGDVIDASTIVELTLSCYVKWLFDVDFLPEWKFVCDSTWEWRKEIAIKGKANRLLKTRVVAWMVELIKNSKYEPLFGSKWAEPEFYSLFLQPLIISPAINITDVAVALEDVDLSTDKMTNIISKALHNQHPFPILERWLPDGLLDGSQMIIAPNTQVFIPLDKMGKLYPFDSPKTKWIGFGAGGRSCAGKQFAMGFMVPLFSIISKSKSKFKPRIGHLYSGRNNDGEESLTEIFYQLKTIVSVLMGLIFKKSSQF